MEKFKIYKHETVVSVTEIEASTAEQALKYARAAEGMPNGPVYEKMDSRNPRISLTPDRAVRGKSDSSEE